MEDERKKAIRNTITQMFTDHDLCEHAFSSKIDLITELAWNNLEDYPEIEVTQQEITQILLMNYC